MNRDATVRAGFQRRNCFLMLIVSACLFAGCGVSHVKPVIVEQEVREQVNEVVLRLAHNLWVVEDPKQRTFGQSWRGIPGPMFIDVFKLGGTPLKCSEPLYSHHLIEHKGNPIPGIRLSEVTLTLKTEKVMDRKLGLDIPLVPIKRKVSSKRTTTEELESKWDVPDPVSLRNTNIGYWNFIDEAKRQPAVDTQIVEQANDLFDVLTATNKLDEVIVCDLIHPLLVGDQVLIPKSRKVSISFVVNISKDSGVELEYFEAGQEASTEFSHTIAFEMKPVTD